MMMMMMQLWTINCHLIACRTERERKHHGHERAKVIIDGMINNKKVSKDIIVIDLMMTNDMFSREITYNAYVPKVNDGRRSRSPSCESYFHCSDRRFGAKAAFRTVDS